MLVVSFTIVCTSCGKYPEQQGTFLDSPGRTKYVQTLFPIQSLEMVNRPYPVIYNIKKRQSVLS